MLKSGAATFVVFVLVAVTAPAQNTEDTSALKGELGEIHAQWFAAFDKGDGAPMDKIEGLKWHLVAKTAGKGDPELDERLSELSPEDRAKVDAAARKWTGTTGK
jgi:hypothetical protein